MISPPQLAFELVASVILLLFTCLTKVFLQRWLIGGSSTPTELEMLTKEERGPKPIAQRLEEEESSEPHHISNGCALVDQRVAEGPNLSSTEESPTISMELNESERRQSLTDLRHMELTQEDIGGKMKFSSRPASVSHSDDSQLGSTSTLVDSDVVVVENLIDLDSDSSKPDAKFPPSLQASFDGDKNYRSHLTPSNDSGISTGSNNRCSTENMSEYGDEYVGIANGNHNGTNGSLLDSPIDPVRTYSNHSMGPTSAHRGIRSSNYHVGQLYRQNGNSSNYSGSRRSSFNSDVDMSVSDVEVHSEITEISTQVQKIQKQLASLEESHFTDDKYVRLKQDNAVLQERIHTLEEQQQQSDERWQDKLAEEKSRHKDLLQRLEREKTLEVEGLTFKCQLAEREVDDCRKERAKMANEVDKLKNHNAQLEDQIADLKYQLGDLASDHEDTSGKYHRLKGEAENQLRLQKEIIEDIKRQLEEAHVQLQKSRQRHSSLSSDRAVELEEEVSRLRMEQRRLEEANEELQAQIFAASVAEGRSLLLAPPAGSLAEEMESMSKDQLMSSLKELEMNNQNLRKYVDSILLRILEMYPAILEIKPGEKGFSPPPS